MVTEQELLDYMLEKLYKPMTIGELENVLHLEGAQDFKEIIKLLNRLEEEGKVYRGRNDRYGIPERMNLIRGRLQAHAKGFGFLIPDNREQLDVYIHANDLHGAMNNDIVLGRTTGANGSGKLEGEIIRVVSRANAQVVGVFDSYEHYAFVVPDDKRITRDIFIPKEKFLGAVSGQKVVVKLVKFPDGARTAAEGEVVEILGHKDDPGVDILSIIRKYELPESFPEDVMEEAEKSPDTIDASELEGRRDLRDVRGMVTIDGEDAKDLDDAVQVEQLANGNVLLRVSIADVGYYVPENSKLDQEAYNRGCSVYLVDRVIPMLPRRLSNGICSLNPQVDRLTLTCEMEIDEHAKVVKHDIYTSVIRTVERMTYTNVRKILIDRDEELIERYKELVADFELMEKLATRLRRNRMNRGAIDFDFAEAKILVDEQGKPTDIVKRERTIAEMIIEEFMLAANETVAEHFHWLKVPFLYRIHEDPDQEKLQHFMEFVTNFGYVVRGIGNKIHPRALQTLLDEIKGKKEETVISTVMLRSMKQAKYDAESTGHFGLAADFYSHFTSPIRRYPDLVIHRVIREVIAGSGAGLSDKRHDYLASRMPDIAKQSSDRERMAADAERETDNLKKAEYMLDKVGEEFEGIISSVTNFGIFVELPNTVEGLIRLSDLADDYYHYHEMQHCLIGERTSKIYRIGDEVKVRVSRVNMAEHNIDFELLETKSREKGDVNLINSAIGAARGRDRDRAPRGRGKSGGGSGKAAGGGRGGAKDAGTGKSPSGRNAFGKIASGKGKPAKGKPGKGKTADGGKKGKGLLNEKGKSNGEPRVNSESSDKSKPSSTWASRNSSGGYAGITIEARNDSPRSGGKNGKNKRSKTK
jgi:ribonuclease R